ncbi:MAG: PLP-dependent aminotransferase family protein, partial [candidate division NC10 bacterium]|nr:PLP-dependent aminotransferase family protein [candidate division NC10 bacterium]
FLYDGSPLPSLWSFYPDECKVHLGTFSKTIVPGMRIAYLVSNPEVVHRLALIKQATDLHTNNLGQWIVNAFLEEGLLREHIEKIRKTYKRRRDLMAASIKQHFPPVASYQIPRGGMFFWVQIPASLNVFRLLEACLCKGVSFVLGSDFFIRQPVEHFYIRLNFTSMDEERIERGIFIIGEEMARLSERTEEVALAS